MRLRRSEGETGKCAYGIFFLHVKTLHLRFDALCVCSRSEITFRVEKRVETKIERLYIRFTISHSFSSSFRKLHQEGEDALPCSRHLQILL